MEEKNKVILAGIIFICLIIAAALVYFFFFAAEQEEISDAGKIEAQDAAKDSEDADKSLGEPVEPLSVRLDESDDPIRELASRLSSHPRFAKWLLSKELVRKFTAAVDNIANGESPRPHIEFFEPDGSFQTVKEGNKLYISAKSYHRYDLIADVFDSLDTESTVDMFRRAYPLLQEAYKELGYPQKEFRDTLVRAIVELLKVPVIDDPVEVVKKVVSFSLVDQGLETLSPAQKHLLRMGPENVEIIQSKLRDFALEMGVPEKRLPGN